MNVVRALLLLVVALLLPSLGVAGVASPGAAVTMTEPCHTQSVTATHSHMAETTAHATVKDAADTPCCAQEEGHANSTHPQCDDCLTCPFMGGPLSAAVPHSALLFFPEGRELVPAYDQLNVPPGVLDRLERPPRVS
jgi:hypothetical protein